MTEPRQTRSRSTAELRLFGRMYRDAFDPDLEIERFAETVLSLARARQHVLGTPKSSMLSFALDNLLPLRVRSARRYLRRDRVAADRFGAFLRFSSASAAEAVGGAASVEDIASAVIAALDDFHAYILANDLVAQGYVAAEHAIADSLVARTPDHDPAPSQVAREEEAPAPSGSDSAAENNLALAA